jgi:hypothetical protein
MTNQTPPPDAGRRAPGHNENCVRRETGKEWRVKVSYGEGSATHTGPESCVNAREGRGEALTGECIGQPLSRESHYLPDADMVQFMEGNTTRGVMRVSGRSGVVTDPGMCGNFLCGNREVLVSGLGLARRGEAKVRGWKARSRSGR